MPKVVLIKDWAPYEGARVRPAGRTLLVTQEGARQLIADGIADLPNELQEGGYGKVNNPPKPKKSKLELNIKIEE